MKLPFRFSPWYTPKYVHMICQDKFEYISKKTKRKRVIPAGQRICSGSYCILFTHPDAIKDEVSEAMFSRRDFCPKCHAALVDMGVLETQPAP